MNAQDLEAIEARVDAATPGPWESDGDYNRAEISQAAGGWATIVGTEEVGSGHLRENVLILSAADSQFIAAARQDIPALLAAVRERDNTIARVRALAGDPSDVDPLSGFKGQPDDMPGVDDFIDHGAWLQKAALRAALDPQETE